MISMAENLKQLINQGLEAIEYLEKSSSKQKLTALEILPQIKNGLLEFLKDKNLDKLRKILDLYKQSHILKQGTTDYSSVWLTETQAQGKTVVLSAILDDIDEIAWKMINNP